MTETRLTRLPRHTLNEEQAAVYDRIAGGQRAAGPQAFALVGDDGALEGPFNAYLYQPALGAALEALGVVIRYETSLTKREREIAILLTAAVHESAFEQYAHEAVGQQVGLSDDEIQSLRVVQVDVLSDERERVVADVVVALLRRGDLDDDEYVRAIDVLKEPLLFEVMILVGHYVTAAMQLRVFRVGAPDGRELSGVSES
jgi:alkylhydroperoxidase family enzyme